MNSLLLALSQLIISEMVWWQLKKPIMSIKIKLKNTISFKIKDFEVIQNIHSNGWFWTGN